MRDFISAVLPERLDGDGLGLQSAELSGIRWTVSTGGPLHQKGKH